MTTVPSDCMRHDKAIETLDVRVRALELWQAKIGGIVLLASVLGSMFGPLLVTALTSAAGVRSP